MKTKTQKRKTKKNNTRKGIRGGVKNEIQKNDKIQKTVYFTEQLLYKRFVSCLNIIYNLM